MTNNKILSFVFSFCFGVIVGAFMATIIVREAVPLRDHFKVILLASSLGAVIFLGLLFWYLKVVSTCKKAFGEKGGRVISNIISFVVVSTILGFIVVVAIFYAAIA